MITHGDASPILADEGVYGVRLNRNGSVVVRGACEELELTASGQHFSSMRRRSIEQGAIARYAKHEIDTIAGEVRLVIGPTVDLSALEFLLDELRRHVAPESINPDVVGEFGEALDDEQAEDAIAEAAAVSASNPSPIDVQKLWRSLIDIEGELFTEGVASDDSSYRPQRKRHTVAFQLERGSLDFASHDKVVVERAHKELGSWSEVGILDVAASTPNAIVVEATGRSNSGSPIGPIIRDGDRLRFRSTLETFSRSRRETATSRILSRQSVMRDLVDYFSSPEKMAAGPIVESHQIVDIEAQYGLNAVQASAFSDLLSMGSLGLVQGPPGTGKTRFIAAFVHYVLATGRAGNVLLASQSNEAVNNAAEEVARLFRMQGQEPSLVRVGQEGAVSSDLRSFHSDRLEEQFKDRFRAELRERLYMIGMRLGLERGLIERLTFAETTIRPVLLRLRDLCEGGEEQRTAGLLTTLERVCEKVGVIADADTDWTSEDAYDELVEAISRSYDVSRDRIRRFLAVTNLAREWSSSISTRQRSFETFLAGTRSIVAGTCVGLGRSALGLTESRFDLVVIDEAARCTASELAVPMQAGRWVVLVGDQLQLEPHHRPDVVEEVVAQTGIAESEILRSDFERVFESTYGKRFGRTLSEQYRMLAPIGRVVSNAFYGGRLSHGRDEPVVPVDALPDFLRLPLLWMCTDDLGGQGHQRNERRSLVNESEVDTIVDLLRDLGDCQPFMQWLETQTRFEKPIGIICTYSAQRDLIRRRLPAAGLSSRLRESCKIDTVDSYQGKQNPIVILSLVRNNMDGAAEGGHSTIRAGFMSRPNRINVALSRAMDRLVIIGARTRWRSSDPMAKVVAAFRHEEMAGNASVVSVSADGVGKNTRGARYAKRSSEVRSL